VRDLGRLLAALALCCVCGLALAGNIEARRAALSSGENGLALSAEFSVELGQSLEDAVKHGVPLYFILELDLTQPRWYWTDEHVAGRRIVYRLSYSALMRQYRLSNGTLYRNFATLNEALRMIARVNGLQVAESGQLTPGETYRVALRLSLDRSRLPKPFQLDALTSKDWQIDSAILRWNYTAEAR
jgi:hypothetical protein